MLVDCVDDPRNKGGAIVTLTFDSTEELYAFAKMGFMQCVMDKIKECEVESALLEEDIKAVKKKLKTTKKKRK